ncbi:hypothetical protein [Aureibacter tunicatorum]|uniref:Holin of 3TMs, for gene-transfer release n=1 Tax=Aureibacter tunicatorum TaxID=866807 RepID=A0AAE3XS51_9BACT|nr:hypothetical protein [Aureibacter tunicatorum]MDR6240975.1 hypothetical protein [Aureibacter tunicatorum]BDD03754.1 hypothetical protein AUTU_12370 [Aureibacter tunicatorum]
MLKGIFAKKASELLNNVGKSIDKLSTSDHERLQEVGKIKIMIMNAMFELQLQRTELLKQEMNGNFLQRSWRPILMLMFGVILMSIFFGWTADVPRELEMELIQIIKIGIGGYVAGRSLEKISERISSNIDLSFLKKKDRGKAYETFDKK